MTALGVGGIELSTTAIPGCAALTVRRSTDARGSFVKLFQSSVFEQLGLPFEPREVFLSVSRRGVVRGMHFQAPPADGDKLVACVAGRAFDVVLDLRRGSPAFGRAVTVPLSAEAGTAVFIPKGCAHGFAALEDGCTIAYVVGSEHDASRDLGVRWDSVGIEWPFDEPIVSDRDAALPALAEYSSPFVYEVAGE